MNYRILTSVLLVASVLSSAPVRAAEETNAPAGKPAGAADKKEPKDNLSETTNTVTINGAAIEYKATAGVIVVRNEEDKPQVSFFFIAYTRLDATNHPENRPISFCFNGGPGSSSVWLHMGVLGPRRVNLKSDGSLPPPPY
jgi:carboxypeptidase C (cathepsin A)